jgi:hypothetical protein
MLDEMGGRLWVAHHNEFSFSMGRLFAPVRRGLERLASWDGTTPQLLSILAAFLITSVGFTSTTSA